MSIECETCCTSCVTCQNCDEGCQGTCDSCQGFCETNREDSNNAFSFSKCVAKDEIIGVGYFSRDTWNEAISQINEVFSQGVGYNGNGKGVSTPYNAESSTISLNSTDLFMTAAEFKRVATAADMAVNDSLIAKDQIIYGSYFSSLANAVAHLHYKSYQCDLCNSSCDVDCDNCQSCNAGCDGCDSQCGDYCCDCCDNNCCDNNTPNPPPPTN